MTQRSKPSETDAEAFAGYRFVLSVPPPRGPQSEPMVSISANGYVRFSSALRRTDAASGDYVSTYYDSRKRLIAFNFTRTRPEDGGYSLRGGQSGFAGGRFFRLHGIDPARHAGRYTPVKYASAELGIDCPGDSFVIDLSR